MSSIDVDFPQSDYDPVLVDGNGTIEAWGTAAVGLLRVYARVFPGKLTINPPTPQKPWPWHGVNPAEGTISCTAMNCGWFFLDAKRVPGAIPNGLIQTLIVWGDFAGEACYALARRWFKGISPSGGGGGGGAAQAPLFKISPRHYKVCLEEDPFQFPGRQDVLPREWPKRGEFLLAYDEGRSTFQQPLWRTMDGENGDAQCTLRVKSVGGRVVGSLAWRTKANGKASQSITWSTDEWDFVSRNVLKRDQTNGAVDVSPKLLVEPV